MISDDIGEPRAFSQFRMQCPQMTTHTTKVVRHDFVVQALESAVFLQFNPSVLNLFADRLDAFEFAHLVRIGVFDENVTRVRPEERLLNLAQALTVPK